MRHHVIRALLLGLTLSACSSATNDVRIEHARQPTFRELEAKLDRLEQGEMVTQMWSLAANVRDLQSAFARGAGMTEQGREDVVRILAAIEQTAMTLDVEVYRAHHAQTGLGAFRSEVRAAREGAERTPPDYYFAGRLVGSCAYCHR
jgi:hypothetical protein